MNLLLIFLALVAAVGACPPPFNNAAFANLNDTAAAIREYRLTSNLGWAEGVSTITNPHTRWPRSKDANNKDAETLIRYCFYGPLDKNDYQTLITDAWKLWADVLGPPGSGSGHSVRFGEFPWSANAAYKFCYKWTSPTDPTLIWNPDLPKSTLVIRSTQDPASMATLGHILAWSDADDKPGRHTLFITKHLKAWNPQNKVNVAHEIGHVLGLEHEHQRSDRDRYVYYRCENLEGYNEAVAKVKARGEHTVQQLCEDPHVSREYDFMAYAYSIGREADEDGFVFQIVNSAKYDYRSIMHYHSTENSNGVDPTKTENLPLTRWVKGSPNFEPPSERPKFPAIVPIAFQYVPTEHDAEGVRHLYPW